jgi:hypothetical protein
MSVLSPSLPGVRSRGQTYGIAAVCRARRLVAAVGGRFSAELGIDLDRDVDEVERWALAATLFGNRISVSTAMRTYLVLEQAGVRTLADAGDRDWAELVALLDQGGYVRYDERTARRLLALAAALGDRHCGRIGTLREERTEPGELEGALAALPGWGPVTVRAFLRELRGLWPGAETALDERTASAAGHLEFPESVDELRVIAVSAHLDVRDLEAGLVRLALSHDVAECPGGEECLLVGSETIRGVAP